MQLSDERCEAFRQLCRQVKGVELTLPEARDVLARTIVLLERFALWAGRERAAGRLDREFVT